MPALLGAMVHRVEREKVTTRPELSLHTTIDKPAAPDCRPGVRG
jgi:hypothetical protein